VGDSILTEIAKSSPSLTSIDLTYNKKITDKGIEALVQNCPNLEVSETKSFNLYVSLVLFTN
jgi:hypothetical protein